MRYLIKLLRYRITAAYLKDIDSRAYTRGFHDGTETHSRCRISESHPSSDVPLAIVCADCYRAALLESESSSKSLGLEVVDKP